MRPLTSPSGIFASIVRGARSTPRAEKVAAKAMLMASKPQPAAVTIEHSGTLILAQCFLIALGGYQRARVEAKRDFKVHRTAPDRRNATRAYLSRNLEDYGTRWRVPIF